MGDKNRTESLITPIFFLIIAVEHSPEIGTRVVNELNYITALTGWGRHRIHKQSNT